MKTKVVVVHADRDPVPGVRNPGPHQLYRNPRVTVEERVLGSLNPDEIRVKMIYAGLCGTDVHLTETNPDTGYVRCSAPARIPAEGRVLGHEGVGRVLAAGSHVRHVRPGSYVTFESIIHCGYCDVCRRGNFNQCLRARLFGLEKDGLFGSVVDIPSILTHNVTALVKTDAGLRAAACVEPASVAYVACENTRVAGGDMVVVFGAGPIGLFAALLCDRVFGASSVYLVEPVEFRRKFAAKWIKHVYDVDEFLERCPRNVDVVLEASGCMANISRLFRRISANGRVALLARGGESLILDAVDHMITNAISVIGSRGHLGGAFARILTLYQSGRLDPGGIVTEVLDGPDKLCAMLKTPEVILQRNCKILVRF